MTSITSPGIVLVRCGKISNLAHFYLLIVLLSPLSAVAVDGRTQVEFSVDAPFSKVVYKFDTEASLRRVLLSQDIELMDYKLTQRRLNLKTQTLDAELRIQGLVWRFSPTPGKIKQAVQLGTSHARLEFILLEPVGQLAEQHYTIDFTVEEKRTKIQIEIYTRVFVPQRRLRFVQRLVNRIARRRVAQELCRAIDNLRWEMAQIISEDRPTDAKSILVP